MKTWNIKHKGHEIRVENGWFTGERLIVDGEMQDEHKEFAFCGQLRGKIGSGDGEGEIIKVSLGGWFRIVCRVLVDGRLIQPGS
ncbi:MAG TPA: hypothetical protein VFB27_12530 [Opitutaceae bacterium]|nr:hypothetical protein [Opitutaceae bacterium]